MLLSALFIALYTLPSCVIFALEIRHIKRPHRVAILSEGDFEIARNYAIALQKFRIFECIFGAIVLVLWANLGLNLLCDVFLSGESALGESLPRESFGESAAQIFAAQTAHAAGIQISQHAAQITPQILPQVALIVAFFAASALISLPLEAYKTLKLDRDFGFTKTSARLFLLDFCKSLALTLALAAPLSAAIIALIAATPHWWLLSFALLFCVVILANLIYPTLIAPMFNKFTPLENPALCERIALLMRRVGFSAKGIFVVDASRRDGRLNAYFGGFGAAKRVVLFDTLLSKVSEAELLAILGHELAHFKHKDIFKNLAILAALLFALLALMGHLPREIFGAIPANPATTIAIFSLIAPAVAFYFLPIVNFFSRRAEFAADAFGAELTTKNDLKSALKKLVNENKAFPYAHPLYIFFHHSHPPLLERLNALK